MDSKQYGPYGPYDPKHYRVELRILELMEEKGKMSLRKLSIKSGISYPTIHNVVKKKQNISLVKLEAIAEALEVPVKSLFS